MSAHPLESAPADTFLDTLGDAIAKGRDLASYLWQVPTDSAVRAQVVRLLKTVVSEARRQGRHEMPAIGEEMLIAAKASPSPQQVDVLVNGFDRLYKLWAAAKSGLPRMA